MNIADIFCWHRLLICDLSSQCAKSDLAHGEFSHK